MFMYVGSLASPFRREKCHTDDIIPVISKRKIADGGSFYWIIAYSLCSADDMWGMKVTHRAAGGARKNGESN